MSNKYRPTTVTPQMEAIIAPHCKHYFHHRQGGPPTKVEWFTNDKQILVRLTFPQTVVICQYHELLKGGSIIGANCHQINQLSVDFL